MYHKWQSYDMGCDGQNVLSYWTIFCTFTSLTTWKIEILKKWKTHLEILSFYTCVQKIMIICYCSWDMVSDTCNCYFSFWAIFLAPPPTPNSPKKQNFKKIKTGPGDIITLHKCTKNYDQMMYGSWDMVRDRRTDRQKKWVPHLKICYKSTLFKNFRMVPWWQMP